MKSNNIINLTVPGKKYLEEKNSAYLAKGFLDNYFGLLELLLIIIKNNKHGSRKSMFNM